jgi:nucleoside-diphosphate kinase
MPTASERTFVMVKPDGVQRGLVGEVIRRIEARGLKLAAMKLMQVDKKLAETHYGEHKGKPFYQGLVDFIISGPVVAMVVEGPNAIAAMRAVNGATNPLNAGPGTIRGDYAVDIGRNIVHASDSADTAAREVKLWFADKEVANYTRVDEKWVRE